MAKTLRKKAKKKTSAKKRTSKKSSARRSTSSARKTRSPRGRRTVMYSRGGRKLYAVRSREGRFKDIQRYSRAHAQDIKRRAKDEG